MGVVEYGLSAAYIGGKAVWYRDETDGSGPGEQEGLPMDTICFNWDPYHTLVARIPIRY